MDKTQEYYHQRAKEYEQVYAKPERQSELKGLHIMIQEEVANADVLEIACGTGYWTETLAKTSKSVHACDYNESVLEIARVKTYDPARVTFQQLDFWTLQKPAKRYDIVFGGFIWSHISLEKLPAFLTLLRQQIKPGGSLIFLDNNYIEGSSTPISKTDKLDNTYQIRTLANGKQYEIIKNFPEHLELASVLLQMDLDLEWWSMEYYWGAVIKELVI